MMTDIQVEREQSIAQQTWSFLLKLVLFCLFLFVTLEIGVRVLGKFDQDGQFYLFGTAVIPNVIPIHTIEANLSYYGANGDSFDVYNPATGWSSRPSFAGDLYVHNADGIRTAAPDTSYSLMPQDGVLRIGLFGDSYVYGGAVTFEDSWGYLLEQDLNARGIKAEVINFGVSAFGLAQDLRYYESLGRKYHLDIALLGFQDVAILKTTNIFTTLFGTGDAIPFSQPRYRLSEDGLELLNDPALPPEQVVEVLSHPESNPLIGYDAYYTPSNALNDLLNKSMLIALLRRTSAGSHDQADFSDSTEHVQLSRAIVDAFDREARADGTQLVLLNTVNSDTQRYVTNGEPMPYQNFMDEMSARYPLIDTAPVFTVFSESDWVESHYSRAAGARVARVVADGIEQCLTSAECALPRFSQ